MKQEEIKMNEQGLAIEWAEEIIKGDRRGKGEVHHIKVLLEAIKEKQDDKANNP